MLTFSRMTVFLKNILLAFIAVLIIAGGAFSILGQTPTEDPDSTSEKTGKETASETEKSNEPDQQGQSDLKVVFDEKTPGVMIIESNGKKFRVDSNKKTVEPIREISNEAVAETEMPSGEKTPAEKVKNEEEFQDDEEEESVWDFEKGEEPFDYRIVNIPTPKSVPKGTWNLSFSHRFSQPLHPLSESGKNLLGFDSFSVSSFGVAYGITDKLYVNAARSPINQRGLSRTIEVGLGYHWLDQNEKSPIALTTYASAEGDENFSKNYTFNLQAMMSRRIGKRVYLFFSPALHINSNGQGRFNPRATDFFPPAQVANTFRLPKHTGSFGFGTAVMIMPDLVALFDFTPRVGFKLGRVQPIFDGNFNVLDFQNISQPTIGFGIQKNIGNHSFTLTFSNTQTTTTSRYNSSNLTFSPRRLILGFNLFRRF